MKIIIEEKGKKKIIHSEYYTDVAGNSFVLFTIWLFLFILLSFFNIDIGYFEIYMVILLNTVKIVLLAAAAFYLFDTFDHYRLAWSQIRFTDKFVEFATSKWRISSFSISRKKNRIDFKNAKISYRFSRVLGTRYTQGVEYVEVRVSNGKNYVEIRLRNKEFLRFKDIFLSNHKHVEESDLSPEILPNPLA